MRFGQNVLRIAWKARFVQFSRKASALFSRIGVNLGAFGDFWIWNVQNAIWSKRPPHRLKSTFCTIFTYWREFQSGSAIFGSQTLKNALWSKRPPHGLKSTFCTIFIQSLQFSRIHVNFSPVKRFLDLKRWKMRFGQNVLRMACKARFVQFLYKAYSFQVLAWISVR